VLSGHPCIDHLFRLPRGWLKSPAAVWSLRRQLRGFDADVAVDMQGLLKSGVATWLTGARLRIGPRILPMSDDPVRTRLLTDEGWMDFQPWFVGRRAAPAVRRIDFTGAAAARPQGALLAALAARPRAVVICPSNPFISIGPILALPGLRDAIRASGAPVIAVSPIIAGQAVKGPTAKMFADAGAAPSAAAVAAHYGDLLDGLVLEDGDPTHGIAPRCFPARTLMTTREDKIALARIVLAAAEALR
jgi:LPPG:FO 2-phospho-L-lactate transferase